jgi:hypothetical protein
LPGVPIIVAEDELWKHSVGLVLTEWAEHKGVTLDFNEPGQIEHNGLIDPFIGTVQRCVLGILVSELQTRCAKQKNVA